MNPLCCTYSYSSPSSSFLSFDRIPRVKNVSYDNVRGSVERERERDTQCQCQCLCVSNEFRSYCPVCPYISFDVLIDTVRHKDFIHVVVGCVVRVVSTLSMSVRRSVLQSVHVLFFVLCVCEPALLSGFAVSTTRALANAYTILSFFPSVLKIL